MDIRTDTSNLSPSSLPANKKYSRRRQEILLTFAAVFAEQGFHGCRTQDVADRLNLKQASLYYYFPSKEAALEEVCWYAVSESTARLRALQKQAKTGIDELICHVIHAYLHDLPNHRDCMIVLNEYRHLLSGDQQERIRTEANQYRLLLQQIFVEAQTLGHIRSDADCALLTHALIDLCHGAARRLQMQTQNDLKHIIEQYSALFFQGVQR